MKTIDQLIQLADRFEKKAQIVDTTLAVPSDVQRAIAHAKLWNVVSLISPLLERANIAPNTSVSLSMTVNPDMSIDYNANLTPPNAGAAQRLNTLLKQRFGALMSKALQDNKLHVVEPMQLNWLTVKRMGQ